MLNMVTCHSKDLENRSASLKVVTSICVHAEHGYMDVFMLNMVTCHSKDLENRSSLKVVTHLKL